MAKFQKGHKPLGNAGRGRPAGVPNKINATLREMILESFNAVGGASYLAVQAYQNPGPYMALIGKTLPLQVGGDPNGDPIPFTEIKRTIVKPKKR